MKATSEEMMIFVAVVESGSFSRAAERLGQANSAISRAVKKLESKLGLTCLIAQLVSLVYGRGYCRRWPQQRPR
jgi:DNA-binding MarR family transcriptional regulator